MSPTVARVGIAGLGLIGGSLGLALRSGAFASRLSGWDREPGAGRQAVELGVIDSACATLAELVDEVDLLVIATPTVAAEAVLAEALERVVAGRARCWITDVASVKGPLCRVAETSPAAERFIPGHPIAGSERSGVAAADGALFQAHRVILTPTAASATEGVALVTAMWECAGALVVPLGVAEHDAVLAATSHLPHAVAFALVNALARSERSSDIFRFAAGGFRDFTRIASSDPVMWRDISVANAPALLEAIDSFAAQLGELRDAVARGDGAALEDTFRAAKSARDEFAHELRARQRRKSRQEG